MQLTYAPQTFTAREFEDAVEFDQVFLVNEDSTVELVGDFAPEVWGQQGPADPTTARGWSFFSRGYTGQWSYNGPEMHVSELFAGAIARDVLATPGVYVLALVAYDCDNDCPQNADEYGEPTCPYAPHYESWVVLTRDTN